MPEYKYAKVDPENCSIEELENEVKRLQDLVDYYDAKQDSEKAFINSVYGAIASKWFFGYNLEVARSITLQGQDLNHFSENSINRYFNGIFQQNAELHAKLGIDHERASQFDISKGRVSNNGKLPKHLPEYSHIEGDYSLCCAGDTDSVYIEFGRLTNWLNIPVKDEAKFVLELWRLDLQPYMNRCYEEYAARFQCDENLENLELEKLCRTAILYAKKHYAMEEVWDEGAGFLPDLDEIVYKGLEVIQGSTPPYARNCQKDFIKYVLGCYINNSKPGYMDLIERLRKYKQEMQVQPIDDICKAQSIGDYNKYVRDDGNELVMESGIIIHVRGAAQYNHYLMTHKKWLRKYSRIKTGDRAKFYYTTDSREVFGFLPNNFPIEFAPPVNYDMQFEKTILAPLNKLVQILGYEPLTVNLCYSDELF